MTRHIFEAVKAQAGIAEVVERFGVKLNAHDKGICPFHSEKTPSFSVKRGDNIFKCFGCGAGGDAVDFVAKLNKVEPLEAARQIAEAFNIRLDESESAAVRKAATPRARPKKSQKLNADIRAYIETCISHAAETDYFAVRGLTAETVTRYGLGYDSKAQRVIIPYSSALDYYCARSTVLTHDDDFFILKPKTAEAGDEPLFAKPQLYAKSSVVFVVESQICALSIMQCGYPAVSICGTSGGGKLLSAVRTKKPSAILVLALDNDPPGEKAQQDLANALFEEGVRFIPYNIAGGSKDPNELLVADAAQLAENLKAAIVAAKDAFRTDKDPVSFADLCKMKLPPIKWAFEGLFGEGLCMICSAPKVGKSWMALELCLNAACGKDFLGYKAHRMGSLYYALEDNLQNIQGRIHLMTGGEAVPSNAHVVIDSDKTDSGFFERLKSQLEEYPDIGFVVVDTLQSIRGKEIKKNDVYGNDVAELRLLKKFALQNGICLVLVHHLRKAKDDSDTFNNILGSTGIWGTLDAGITLMQRTDSPAEIKMEIRGRNVKRGELIITQDGKSFRWSTIGTPEQQAVRMAKSEYASNPVVRTVKWLVQQQPYGWSGTSSEIMTAAIDMCGEMIIASKESVGKSIIKFKVELYQDGVDYTERRTSKKRIYKLFKRGLKNPQRSMIDDDSSESEE